MAADPIAVLAELEARSRNSARGLPQQEEQSRIWDGVGFRIGDATLVAPLSQVREILPCPPITRVPNAKGWLWGVANVRGTLITVVDAAEFLGLAPIARDRNTRILIAQDGGIAAGLAVAELFGMKHFREETFQRGVGVEPWAGGCIEGAYDQDDRRWGVFNLHALLARPEFVRAAA